MTNTEKLILSNIILEKHASFLGKGVQLAFKNLGRISKNLAPSVGANKPLLAAELETFSPGARHAGDTAKSLYKTLMRKSKAAVGAPKFSPERDNLAKTLSRIRNKQFSPMTGSYDRVNFRGNPVFNQ
jgi:hypothetical protein